MQKEMRILAQSENIDLNNFFASLPDAIKMHSACTAGIVCDMIAWAKANEICTENDIELLSFEEIYKIVCIHDIGFVAIPERIAFKASELTRAEECVLQKHTTYGAKLVQQLADSCQDIKLNTFYNKAAQIILSHHERWDGTGYPFKQRATAIPFLSRCIHLAGSFDAILRGGAFRMPLPSEYALLEISDNKATQFDPQLCNYFTQCEEQALNIREHEENRLILKQPYN